MHCSLVRSSIGSVELEHTTHCGRLAVTNAIRLDNSYYCSYICIPWVGRKIRHMKQETTILVSVTTNKQISRRLVRAGLVLFL